MSSRKKVIKSFPYAISISGKYLSIISDVVYSDGTSNGTSWSKPIRVCESAPNLAAFAILYRDVIRRYGKEVNRYD